MLMAIHCGLKLTAQPEMMVVMESVKLPMADISLPDNIIGVVCGY